MEKKVANVYLFDSCYYFLAFLQRKLDSGKDQSVDSELFAGFNPGIKITFASDVDIDACLALPSLVSVGAANGVPQLNRGEKIFC